MAKELEEKSKTTSKSKSASAPKSNTSKTVKATRGRPKKSTTDKKVASKETAVTKPTKKLVIITGATSGMGLEVTKRLVAQGDCCVIAVGRRPQLCRDIMLQLRQKYPELDLHFLVADLSIMAQVRALVEDIEQKMQKLGYEHIDVLYLNAGVMTQDIQMTYEGHEVQWATNYLSACLLTELLYPYIRKSVDGRIIFMTDDKARKLQLDWRAIREPKRSKASKLYEQTKLADLMFALEFDYRHLDEENVKTFAVNPGKVLTPLTTKGTTGFRRWLNDWRNINAVSIEEGISTVMYLINAPKLPVRVVYYKDSKPQMPSKYVLDSENRLELYNATRRMLGLPPCTRENKIISDE